MKKLFKMLALPPLALFIAAVITSCTSVTPGYGIGSDAIVPDVAMEKTGEASGTFLFGCIPLPYADISLATAAANGDIKRIATVDTRTYSILGVIVTKTTIVTGDGGRGGAATASASTDASTATATAAAVASGEHPDAGDVPTYRQKVLSVPFGSDGSALIDAPFLQGAVRDNIYITNLSREQNLAVSVAVRKNKSQAWEPYDKLVLKTPNSEQQFHSSLARKLMSYAQFNVTVTAQSPLRLLATVSDKDLYLYVVSADAEPQPAFVADTAELAGNGIKQLAIQNLHSEGALGFDIYVRNAADERWQQLGVAFIKDTAKSRVQLLPDAATAVANWRYFGIVPHNQKRYTYNVSVAGKDALITLQAADTAGNNASAEIALADGEPAASAGAVVVAVASLQGKLDENVHIINATHERPLTVTIETRTAKEQVWRTYGTVNIADINGKEELEGNMLKNLKRVSELMVTSSATAPFTVRAYIDDEDLFLCLLPASAAATVDYEIDATTIAGKFKDNVRIINQSDDANMGFDVYARKTDADKWLQIGAAFVKGKSDGDTVNAAIENVADYRYFAVAPHNGKNYRYTATKARNDLVITVQSK